jgi:hypothetical protein
MSSSKVNDFVFLALPKNREILGISSYEVKDEVRDTYNIENIEKFKEIGQSWVCELSVCERLIISFYVTMAVMVVLFFFIIAATF